MKIFISWSGERSRRVAAKLREWLPLVLHGSEPWLSSDDIRKGATWQSEMSQALKNPAAGILCLTQENISASWLVFEAGAISQAVTGTSFVCTYLIDVDNADVGLPLGMFQSTAATPDDTLRLLQNLNSLATPQMPNERLTKLFASFWPELEAVLADARHLSASSRVRRDEYDLLEEVLDTVRGLARAVNEHQPEADFDRLLRTLTSMPSTDAYALLKRLSNIEQRALLEREIRRREEARTVNAPESSAVDGDDLINPSDSQTHE